MTSFRAEVALFLAAIALAEYASPWRGEGRAVALLLAVVLTARLVAEPVRHIQRATHVGAVLRAAFVQLGLNLAAFAFLVSQVSVWLHQVLEPATQPFLEPVYRRYGVLFLLVAGLRLVVGHLSVPRILDRLALRPAQTVAAGFASAIFLGTLLLMLPLSVAHLEVSLLDALFMATSAVTVSGLVVSDPASFYTGFGQGVLLVLIQLGGIGTMAASASLVVLAGRRLRLRREAAIQETMDVETIGQVGGQLRAILGATFAIEAAGAMFLYLLWRGDPRVAEAAFAAVFHAISAFCNAGFSILPSGLMPFRDDVATSGIVAVLILLGGLGFPVLRVAAGLAFGRQGARPAAWLTLHARLALLTTVALLASGGLAALVLEWGGTLRPLSWSSRVLAASFLSVTARTAGFDTLDVAVLAPATLWVLMLLMFVGGNPGSTAGGIKTTTFATVVAALWATVRGRPHVEAFRRTIPEEQVAKALALGGISAMLVGAGVTSLLATQSGEPLALAFEAVSAFGTVGLSTGVTPTLNGWGKVVIMALMFVGRTGPLTLGFALAARRVRHGVTYPAEKIMIG